MATTVKKLKFSDGSVYIGEVNFESGPDGVFPANELSKSLQNIGVELRRFKTGTPARVDSRTTAKPGQPIKFAFDVEKIHVFDKETEMTICN